MSDFYQNLQDNVARPLIERFGASLTLTRDEDTTLYIKKFDPVQGRHYWENTSDASITYEPQPSSTSVTYTGSAVRTRYKESEIDGNNVRNGDVKLIALDIPSPKQGDKITFDGTTYEYVWHRETSPSGFAVIYTIQVRV